RGLRVRLRCLRSSADPAPPSGLRPRLLLRPDLRRRSLEASRGRLALTPSPAKRGGGLGWGRFRQKALSRLREGFHVEAPPPQPSALRGGGGGGRRALLDRRARLRRGVVERALERGVDPAAAGDHALGPVDVLALALQWPGRRAVGDGAQVARLVGELEQL